MNSSPRVWRTRLIFELVICSACNGLFLPIRSANRLHVVSKQREDKVEIAGLVLDGLNLLDLIRLAIWSR